MNAQALFEVTGPNAFTITLYNLETIRNAGQLLTGLQFDLANQPVTLSHSSGTEETVLGYGNISLATAETSTGWGFGSIDGSGTSFLLCVICGDGVTASHGVPPTHGIISPTVALDVNSSITGGSHDPFLATYWDSSNVLHGPTFSFTTGTPMNPEDSSLFSNVVFLYGTTFGVSSQGTPVEPNPEPLSMVLAGGGLIGISVIMRRRRLTR